MKKTLIASLIAASFAAASGAGAADGDVSPWLLRLRAINIDPQSSSTAGGAAGLPEDAISVQNRWAPEIDISYFFTKSIALELIATYPQSQPVSLECAGVYVGGIGNVKHLPPTLLVQYHFNWEGNPFKPYVGAGINFTWFTESNLAVPLFHPGQFASQRLQHELGTGAADRRGLQADGALVPERRLQVHLDRYPGDEQQPRTEAREQQAEHRPDGLRGRHRLPILEPRQGEVPAEAPGGIEGSALLPFSVADTKKGSCRGAACASMRP